QGAVAPAFGRARHLLHIPKLRPSGAAPPRTADNIFLPSCQIVAKATSCTVDAKLPHAYCVADATLFCRCFMHDVNKAVLRRASLSDQAVAAARQVLAGQRGGVRAYLTFAGPAVIASIAYMDPGNFATNIQAGAKYGYSLLWVVLLANLIAMLFQ